MQVHPSGPDTSRVPNLAMGVLLKLGCRVGHAAQFVSQIVGIGTVVPPLEEFISAALDLIVEFNINSVICTG
jgi:hypothetical protein